LGKEKLSHTTGTPTALARGLDPQPGVGGGHAGDTARKGYPAMKNNDEKFKNYLSDLGQLVKEYALAAVEEREKHRGQPMQEFYDGYVLGFHRFVSLMQQQALAFGINLKDLHLDEIEPDRDLVP
jgi:hypothetical protein